MQFEQIEHTSEYMQSHQEIFAFQSMLGKELTPIMASAYVHTLVAHLGGIEKPYVDLLEEGNILHEQVGKDIYGPLIVGYCDWVQKQCETIGHTGMVHMALRDANPMLVAAQVLWDGGVLIPHGIYMNRPILGIADEISGDETGPDAKVFQYLSEHGIHPNGHVVLCDSGAWGTVVKEMKQKLLPDTLLFPFFWFSHNPYIPGYINGLLTELGMPEEAGEVINDSLECLFPQCVTRPTHTIDVDGHIDVVVKPNGALAVSWGTSALIGVKEKAIEHIHGISHDEELTALQQIMQLSKQAKETGSWTGVLPDHTPTWSQGKTFLAQWPAQLLP